MVKRKSIRTRGKIALSKYFQNFKEGDTVAVAFERAVRSNVPLRLQGRTGVVCGKKGAAYLVKIKDQTMEKEYIIPPIHLKKIKK